MIEDTKIVKTIEVKSGGKSGTYWSVTWQDGKKDNIFNADWLPLLEHSQQDNRLLHFTKEKKGNYFNIVSLELATLPEAPPSKTPEPQKMSIATGKETPKYKADPAKTESIERQVSLKAAVELAVADKVKVEEIISYATVFDMFLSGEFTESRSEIIAKYIAKYGRKEVN